MLSLKESLQKFLHSMKDKIGVLYEVAKNPSTPLLAKIIVSIALAYALSPIDLIPDFIPVLGLLDDLIILSALIFIAYKLIPKNIWDEARKNTQTQKNSLPKNWFMATIIILFWLAITLYLFFTFVH